MPPCRGGRPRLKAPVERSPGPHPEAVVDAGGRVLGLERLWVIDASVMPRLPSANTHLPVIALAERLAAGFLAAAA